ncbi:aminotransferase class I/II-fold pyridoxal phosphate-dependent enzyme [Chloroflexota bacterium]
MQDSKKLSESQNMKPIDQLTTNFFATLNAKVVAIQATNADVIRLDIGSPDLPPAPYIIETLSQSARRADAHGYQSHRGSAALREAWAEMYRRVHGVLIDPESVLPLMGSKEGVFHLSQAVLNTGDVVLVPNPGYLTYTQGARFAGAEPFFLPLLPENRYLPDLNAMPLNIRQRAKILWLNYPNNPTTAVAPLEFFSQAVAFCRRYGILLCHDSAYTQVTFENTNAPSVLEVSGANEVCIEFNTLSKSHNMAGWRVGAAVGNSEAVTALLKLKTHADSGHFGPVLDASVAAMLGDQSWLDERNLVYQERRDVVITALRGMGFSLQEPRASLYVWCPIPEDWVSSSDFALTLLEQAHVSLAPGIVFGPGGEGFVRISLVQPMDRLNQAMERIQHVMRKV